MYSTPLISSGVPLMTGVFRPPPALVWAGIGAIDPCERERADVRALIFESVL